MEGGDSSINYAKLQDDVIPEELKINTVKEQGYFIYPSRLFENIVQNAEENENLNTDIDKIFKSIESSADGFQSQDNVKGLFADFDTTSKRLGNTVKERNQRLCAVLKGVNDLRFGNFENNEIDLFGDAYEFLISNYAANAGKSGGEFFTPQSVSKLIARLAMEGQEKV